MDTTIIMLLMFACVFSALPVDALRCYKCNSVNTPNCKDPFKSTDVSTTECIGHCMKGKKNADMGGEQVRQCADNDKKENVCEKVSRDELVAVACYCNTDYCNSAAQTTSNFVAIFVTTIAVSIFKGFD